jgi:cyclase
VPVIASGGAGDYAHFADLFEHTGIDGGLAASVFHSGQIPVPKLKQYLKDRNIEVRI